MLLAKEGDLTSLKLVDMGCAKFTHDRNGSPISYTDFGGSLIFAAPEVIAQYAYLEGNLIKAVDMWSVGVIAYLLTTGRRPFGSKNESEGQIRNQIYQCSFSFPSSLKLSSALQHFITRLLVAKPEDRMTVDEALNHPWILNSKTVASRVSFEPIVISGLREYQRNYTVRKHIVRLLVQLMSDKEQEYIVSLFKKYDDDGSGFLEPTEISKILKEGFGLSDDDARSEALSVVEEFDENSDGVLSLEEFTQLSFHGIMALDRSNLRRAFNALDENSDGVISKDELRKALTNAATKTSVSEQDLIHLMDAIDENSDGLISFDEFVNALGNSDVMISPSPQRSPRQSRKT